MAVLAIICADPPFCPAALFPVAARLLAANVRKTGAAVAYDCS
jgi:hypothetical protein